MEKVRTCYCFLNSLIMKGNENLRFSSLKWRVCRVQKYAQIWLVYLLIIGFGYTFMVSNILLIKFSIKFSRGVDNIPLKERNRSTSRRNGLPPTKCNRNGFRKPQQLSITTINTKRNETINRENSFIHFYLHKQKSKTLKQILMIFFSF
jgi:hypothetical protein